MCQKKPEKWEILENVNVILYVCWLLSISVSSVHEVFCYKEKMWLFHMDWHVYA